MGWNSVYFLSLQLVLQLDMFVANEIMAATNKPFLKSIMVHMFLDNTRTNEYHYLFELLHLPARYKASGIIF